MAGNSKHTTTSTETILTFENKNMSQWSMVWSTAHVPGMDAGMGGAGRSRRAGDRRRLTMGSFVLGALLTMHCRVTASAISGSFFVFIMFLIIAVVLLANPLRHFEIYLGQWSISGPGRAFRIIPMFDGIGIAICINAIIRAIACCTMASITAVYVFHAVSDERLPFTYCRDFNLKSYEPALTDVKSLRSPIEDFFSPSEPTTVGFGDGAWRNITFERVKMRRLTGRSRQTQVCKEVYSGYPTLFDTPSYNFFYVEVVHFRSDFSFTKFNLDLIIFIVFAWIIMWAVIMKEKLSNKRLVWNNTYTWLVVVPWLWVAILAVTALTNVESLHRIMRKAFRLDSMEILAAIADALQVALYIHSAGTGTEIIVGKGLNHYASGHIDPQLNAENVWYSGLVLLLAVINCTISAFCALADAMQVTTHETAAFLESSLWVIPMYSNCASTGTHSHLMSTLIFSGLTFSYMVVGYTFLKTALHIIFEYRVKLVFVEQAVVAALIGVCLLFSLLFATNGGIPFLESLDAVMTGVVAPLLCLQELAAMLWIYRSRDFVSDMNVATEENACAGRIGTQWQIIPFIVIVIIVLKVPLLIMSRLPTPSLFCALLPLVAIVLAVMVRACVNAYVFFKPMRRI